MRVVGFAWMLLVTACQPGCRASPQGEGVASRWTIWSIEVEPLEGMSGLTVDGEGRFWAIPERLRALQPLVREAGRLVPDGPSVPLEGVEESLDTESITWVAGRTFLLGTERQAPRTYEELLWIEIEDGKATVRERLRADHALWGLRGRGNHGVEGVCHAGGWVLVGLELVREDGAMRRAPLGLLRLDDRRWVPLWLELTSRSGKLAGLTCRMGADGASLDVWAIERHFGVSRLLRVRVPIDARAPQTSLEASRVVDLASHFDELPNFEGIAYGAGALWLISDNHYGRRTGPTWGLRVPLKEAAASAP